MYYISVDIKQKTDDILDFSQYLNKILIFRILRV